MLFALLFACVTDPNENHCTYFDAVSDGDDIYCIDEDAPEACEEVIDAIIAAFEACLGRRFDEELAREAAEDSIDCDAALATTGDLEACVVLLADPECDDDDMPVVPEACDGAILVEAR